MFDEPFGGESFNSSDKINIKEILSQPTIKFKDDKGILHHAFCDKSISNPYMETHKKVRYVVRLKNLVSPTGMSIPSIVGIITHPLVIDNSTDETPEQVIGMSLVEEYTTPEGEPMQLWIIDELTDRMEVSTPTYIHNASDGLNNSDNKNIDPRFI